MKYIGLIGGLSAESTREYERIIVEEHAKVRGKAGPLMMTVDYLDLKEFEELQIAHRWDEVASLLKESMRRLSVLKVDFAAIASNTPHNAYDLIKNHYSLKLLTIMDATADAVKKDGKNKVGFIGTKPTMEYGLFQKTFSGEGIELLMPDEEDRQYIDDKIWGELVKGKFLDETRKGYLDVISRLQRRGAQGIILGCTEIPQLIRQEDCSGIKVYDTTNIHAKAILEYALR